MCHCTLVDIKTIYESGFSPYTTWILGIDLRSTALLASTVTAEPSHQPWAVLTMALGYLVSETVPIALAQNPVGAPLPEVLGSFNG